MTNIAKQLTVSAGKKLCGNVSVLSSKSELHRLIFCACLSDKSTVIKHNHGLSKDIRATISCFESLGAKISFDDNKIVINKPLDFDYISKELSPDTVIFCSESGSTARFLLPLLSLVCKNGAVMDGEGKLPTRPFSDLCNCLSQKGASFSSHTMPIRIENCIKPEGEFLISGNISSQYLSGLLFILPFCENAKITLTTPLESSGYVDMTISAMAKFGVKVTESNGTYTCSGSYSSPCDELYAGGDWSNAAFFMCGAGEKGICLSGMDPQSLQPDKAISDILAGCGMTIWDNSDGICIRRDKNILPFDVDAGETPDIVPILCVFAASICGKSVIRNIRRLRFKESDRVTSACALISSLGGNIYADENNIYIEGKGTLDGGTADSFNDHRIAMSAAIAAGFCKNDVTICGADAVTKSYPDFFEILKSLTEVDQ